MRYAIAAVLVAACGSHDVGRSVGAECVVNADCDERCLTDFPGGFCTISCDNDNGCPRDTFCADENGGVCLFACSVNADCDFLGQGYLCRAEGSHGGPGEVSVCRPG
jgi:hypothetical protein